MKVIVTGASGFIGTRLVAELIVSGYQVAAVGRKHTDSISISRTQFLAGSKYIQGDLNHISIIEDQLRNSGYSGDQLFAVIHLAWGGKERLSDLDVDAQCRNIATTIECYEMAVRLEASRFLFCGSMEEAFAQQYTFLDYHRDSLYNRHVVYALAKSSARQALKSVWRLGAPDIIFGTNSHVIGPGDDKDSFLQVALTNILSGKDISMSSGEQRFDVINVSDCAKAYIAIAEKGLNGSEYWVGSGESRPLRDYVEEMNSTFPSVNIFYGSAPFNDVRLNSEVFDTKRTTLETGFTPSISFLESIQELAFYLLSTDNRFTGR
jgi:nucleoside-diphosphate-sugar epimerase